MKVVELNKKVAVLRFAKGGILALIFVLALVGIINPTSTNSGGGIA
ncbi:MAG: hypothetical protein ACP5MH_06910 [Thermoproteus sp.]